MKLVLTALVALSPLSALAHGTAVHQAAEAIERAGQIFAENNTKESQRMFSSVAALRTGREQFTVTITLTNGAQASYACQENEDVNPVVWECEAK